MSIDVVLVSFFVNFGHISHCFLVFLLLTSGKIVSLRDSTELNSYHSHKQQSIINLLNHAVNQITYSLLSVVEVSFTAAT